MSEGQSLLRAAAQKEGKSACHVFFSSFSTLVHGDLYVRNHSTVSMKRHHWVHPSETGLSETPLVTRGVSESPVESPNEFRSQLLGEKKNEIPNFVSHTNRFVGSFRFLRSARNYRTSGSTRRRNEVTALRGFSLLLNPATVRRVFTVAEEARTFFRRAASKFRLHRILFPFNGVRDCINLNHLS